MSGLVASAPAGSPAWRDAPGLERIGRFVPDTTVSVADLRERLGLTPVQVAYFTRYLGLDRIAVAGGTDLTGMLVAAGADALRDVDRDSVRHLLHAHTMQHVATSSPHLLDDVRRALGLHRASASSLSHLNCTVGLHALSVARCLLHGAPPGHKVLVVVGDRIVSDRLRLIPDTTILGEAAAACLVGRDPGADRVLGRALIVAGRFAGCTELSDELRAEYKEIYPGHLYDVMRSALDDAGIAARDIALVLPHNVNRLTWKRAAGRLGIPMERFFLDNVPRYGHCYSADPFLNLATARETGRAGPGDLVLMVTAGLGAAFAATVVRLGPGAAEPARHVPKELP